MKTFELEITETCTVCKKEIIREEGGCGTGYAIDNNGNKICYACCGEADKKTLLETGKLSGYYSHLVFTNWPGSFKIKAYYSRDSWHNFAGRNGRTDFWLNFEGKHYHGVHIGHDNECATIRLLKK